MKHITTTTLAVGAQKICANSEGHTLPGMGSIARQPVFRPILRRDVMSAVNTCGRDLGLRQGAVVVLDALLSCLPCQGPDGRETAITPATLLTIYASNQTLCFRAKGLTDRQLRRHLETLENAGLLLRRDSANGKRFPVLKDGKPIGAFGLDLSPLFARADELLALALKQREQAEELRGLRAQILRLRAACLELHLDDAITAFVKGLHNLVRRSTLTLVEARATLGRLTAVVSGHATSITSDASDEAPVSPSIRPQPEADGHHRMPEQTSAASIEQQITPTPTDLVIAGATTGPASNTDETPASDGQDVRHIEPESDTKKRKALSELLPQWSDLTQISAFYEEPQSALDTAVIAFEFGKMLRISQELLASAAASLGLWKLLKIEDQIASNVETILSPDAYFRSILRGQS